ncbi:MAG TPA: alpha/beta fold hydrolase [Vicinamibacterales bacterium]
MIRALLVVTVFVFGAHSARAQQVDEATLIARGQDVVARLVSGDVEPLLPSFTEKMQAAANANFLRRLIPGLIAQLGPFKSQTGARFEQQGVMRVVLVSCAFERGNVEIRVAFDPKDRIGGLGVPPPAPAVPYTTATYVTPALFRDDAITVDAGGWPLPGVLSMPAGEGPFPGVVLVHGSGPNDRDETVGSNKPFRDLAEGLASRGIAVLRYDKRTRAHAANVASLSAFTVKEEVVDDAVAAVKKLRDTRGIRPDRVFVLGHSLGAMLAPRIAAADNTIAGLIIMAAPARPLEQAIVDQTRYLALLDGSISPEEQQAIDGALKLAADVAALKPDDPPITSTTISAPASYWLDLRGYDAPAAAARLTLPMLVLQGARDYQVTMEDFAAWRRAVGSRDNVTVKSYPALNHLFIAGSGASTPAEYLRAGHVDAAVVLDIAAWITR